jgi:hypothetical protein
VAGSERDALRAQALAWLKADLAMWQERSADESELVVKALTIWQTDADLSSIRDAAALSSLSSDEADACRALWRDVALALEQAKKAQ